MNEKAMNEAFYSKKYCYDAPSLERMYQMH